MAAKLKAALAETARREEELPRMPSGSRTTTPTESPQRSTVGKVDQTRVSGELRKTDEAHSSRLASKSGNGIDQLALFRDAAIHSGLIDERQWNDAVSLAREDGMVPQTEAIAKVLVRSGELTSYQAQQLQSGRSKLTLGPYLITDWIGQGGMGQVFKGVHNVMGRECAVKVLPLEKSTPESRESFIREIRLQAGLDHPHLVRAFDAGQDGNVHYLVTEYVPGTDLRKYVRGKGTLTVNRAASIVSQAARGLQYAHELGLIHRDVKPGNILVTPDGHAKVSDVGLAAWTMGIGNDPRAGKVVGTADYLSPEQILTPLKIGPASDVYSLGCTLYYAITGKVPFPGGDSRSKCRRHCEQTPWHPRKFVPDLPEEFVDVIADMMEKDVDRRIGTALEAAERLEPWSQVLQDTVDRPIGRQSWAAPPPPMETAGDPSGYQVDELVGAADEEESAAPSVSRNDQSGSFSAPPVPGNSNDFSQDASLAELSRLQSLPKPSHTLAIAITLALAVPVSLLIGAVLGFLAHEMW